VIETLSYIGFTSPRSSEWNTFGPDVMGLEVAEPGPDGAVRLRMDDACYRIAIHPGDVDDIAYLGWGVSGPAEFSSAIAALGTAGVSVTRESAELAGERCVLDLMSFDDPFGLRNEVSWGQLSRPSTFRPGRAMSGFVTGQGGLGHAVILSPNLEVSEKFYVDLLGFRLTDQIQSNGSSRIRFYNCNQRHHTLAMVEVQGVKGFHHLMLETQSLDDVGNALDLVGKSDTSAELAMDIGRHTNDKMTSFYVKTPAGFEIEYGYGGVVLDDDVHLPRFYDRTSIWGHAPQTPTGSMPPPAIIHVLEPESNMAGASR
jgi:extradiol dioxygenase